jgi:integral membrane sensor domain MASE1
MATSGEMVMKTFIFLLFLFLMIVGMRMGDMFGILIAMAGFLFMWALMDDNTDA